MAEANKVCNSHLFGFYKSRKVLMAESKVKEFTEQIRQNDSLKNTRLDFFEKIEERITRSVESKRSPVTVRLGKTSPQTERINYAHQQSMRN